MKYIYLALLQGLTEFLPVSSSGHLVFFQKVFGFQEPLLCFDIILHLATALSVIIFLKKDLQLIIYDTVIAIKQIIKGKNFSIVWQEYNNFRLGVFVCVAIAPAIIFGLFFHAMIESMFSSLKLVGVSFLGTGTVLFITKYAKQNSRHDFNLKDALSIGLAQAVAIIPGISRSGLTISSGILRGLDRNLAARFSFILAVPTIIAAGVYKLKHGIGEINISILILTISFLVAFLSGYVCLIFLSKMIAKAKFHYFAYYCWFMGLISIFLTIFYYR
ncbi:MAG: undecaprenyl-diphosphate phosphatase [Candidatus Omnitrophota bacterium]